LISTTLGAKSGSSDFLTTRFAEGHERVPPGDQFGWSVTKRLAARNEISTLGPPGNAPAYLLTFLILALHKSNTKRQGSMSGAEVASIRRQIREAANPMRKCEKGNGKLRSKAELRFRV